MLSILLQTRPPHPFFRFPSFMRASAEAGCPARNRRT
jgi:hypothetical protein